MYLGKKKMKIANNKNYDSFMKDKKRLSKRTAFKQLYKLKIIFDSEF